MKLKISPNKTSQDPDVTVSRKDQTSTKDDQPAAISHESKSPEKLSDDGNSSGEETPTPSPTTSVHSDHTDPDDMVSRNSESSTSKDDDQAFKSPSRSPQEANTSHEAKSALSNTTVHPDGFNILYKQMCIRDEKMDALMAQNQLMEGRISKLEQTIEFVQSMLHVKDCVLNGIQSELQRLQQYTRRYSVSIFGIPKPRGEKPDVLRTKVDELINLVESTTTSQDIDKLHRNGPLNGDEQETIVRFKSHAAKEAFYKARKTLPVSHRQVKIRPSLSPAQKILLNEAQDYLENVPFDEADGSNPPEFVFANIHGNVQVKMKKQTKEGLFINIKSVEHLSQVIARAQDSKERVRYHHEKEQWADGVSEEGSDDDMGFSLFT